MLVFAVAVSHSPAKCIFVFVCVNVLFVFLFVFVFFGIHLVSKHVGVGSCSEPSVYLCLFAYVCFLCVCMLF